MFTMHHLVVQDNDCISLIRINAHCILLSIVKELGLDEANLQAVVIGTCFWKNFMAVFILIHIWNNQA